MDYPTDAYLDENRDLQIDQGGDIATISGFEQLEQSVELDVLDAVRNFIGEGLTGRNVGLLEQRVEAALKRDEQVGEILTVNLSEYNQETGSVKLEVHVVENEDFMLELSP